MADCKSCKSARAEVTTIPYAVHEGDMSRMERIIKRLWVVVILLIILLVGSNVVWVAYESQFSKEVTTETYTAETDGCGTAIANGSGEVSVNG